MWARVYREKRTNARSVFMIDIIRYDDARCTHLLSYFLVSIVKYIFGVVALYSSFFDQEKEKFALLC